MKIKTIGLQIGFFSPIILTLPAAEECACGIADRLALLAGGENVGAVGLDENKKSCCLAQPSLSASSNTRQQDSEVKVNIFVQQDSEMRTK